MPSKCYEFKSLGLKTNFETKKYSKARNIDRQFEERVKLYIQENKHKSIIDADALVDSLRRTYPEYMRRQRAAVKYLAGRVIALLTDEYDDHGEPSNQSADAFAIDKDDRSNLSNISSDDEVSTISRVSLPSMDNTMSKLYKTAGSNASTVSQEEFINISSDDDSAEEHRSNNVPTFTLEDDPQVGCTDTLLSRKRKLCDTSESTPTALMSVDTTTNGIMRTNSTPIVQESKKTRSRTLNRFRNKTNEQKNNSKVNESVIADPANAYIPNITLANVAGCSKVIAEIAPLLANVHHPEIYDRLEIDPPRGILLHGPPGCGKTLLARAIAGDLKVPLLDVAGPELVAGVSGISEQRIRKLFSNAIKVAPCILFLDEIDCITQSRDPANRHMENRIVSQLLSSMDKLNHDAKKPRILVIGATNRPDSLDPALRRAGRFDREVCLGIPSKESRFEILRFMCSKLKLSDDVNLQEVAAHTPGYVGADLLSLIRVSSETAVHRVMELVSEYHFEKPLNTEEDSNDSTGTITIQCDMSVDSVSSTSQTNMDEKTRKMLSWIRNRTPIDEAFLEDVTVMMDDIKVALKRVQPSSKREGFATIPDVTWDDIGSLKDIRRTLKLTILGPLKRPKLFNQMGQQLSSGVMFCGPPGCGKTLLAKALANEAGINFISVKGPELLNMYVGGSEKAVRECFQRAKNSQPCVIFFDELDSLCPRRNDHSESGSSSRVVNQLLTEMDGLEDRKGVFITAATNRPDMIDPAVLRPGRLDKIIYVGFPNEEDRADILQALTKNGTEPRMHESVNLTEIAKNPLCEGFTGADLAGLVRDSCSIALDERMSEDTEENDSLPVEITAAHFEKALKKLRPSVSKEDRKYYERLRLEFATSKYELQEDKNQS